MLTLLKLLIYFRYSAKKENVIMKSVSVTVSSRGYIVLPAKIRKEMEIKTGTKVLITKEKDRLILQPIPSFTERLIGITQQSFGRTPKEINEYLDEARKDETYSTSGP